MPFNFKKFWLGMTKEEREVFATESGTTSHYIQTHLTGKRRIPSKALMDSLFKACKNRKAVLSKSELVDFFYS